MNHLPIAKEALFAQAQAISQLAERLDGEFQRAVELILGCKCLLYTSDAADE